MFEKIKRYKVIIISIVIIILAIFLYQKFVLDKKEDASINIVAVGGDVNGVGQEMIRLLYELNRIKFDTSIFEDPLFNSLVDHSLEVVAEPLGRPDPFAPIGSEVNTETTIAEPIDHRQDLLNINDD
jgi:hypothetical protein